MRLARQTAAKAQMSLYCEQLDLRSMAVDRPGARDPGRSTVIPPGAAPLPVRRANGGLTSPAPGGCPSAHAGQVGRGLPGVPRPRLWRGTRRK